MSQVLENCIAALNEFSARPKTGANMSRTDIDPTLANEIQQGDNVLMQALSNALFTDPYSMFSLHGIKGTLPFEDRLCRTWDEFESLEMDEWARVRDIVDIELAGALMSYSIRMATLAVREREKRRLRDATIALVVDKDLVDYRDLLTAATLVYDAAMRIDADPELVFRAAMKYATPDRRAMLDSYLSAPSFTKSIRSKGFDAVETDEGFAYRMLLD